MKYRITHPDPYNWCIEEWQEGGATIEKGRFMGGKTTAKWKAPSCYYPSLKEAAMGLMQKAIGDSLLNKEANTILEAINLAEKRVLETLSQMK
jgi:hypothetical protein